VSFRQSLSLCLITAASATIAWAAGDEPVETVHVVITGGTNAGTYDVTGTRGGCSYGLSGPGSWGNQLSSSEKDPKKLNSLQLIVPDAKAAASGAKEFYLKAGFGPLLHRSAEYEVDTRKDAKAAKGSGTVTVKDRGTTGTVTFSAATADGVKMEGTIECNKVVRGQ
jgi:hypothetical protein